MKVLQWFCFQNKRETVSQMQPFLQFLVDFGSCDMDECHNEQQQLQYGSNASVWNKFVACKQAKYEAGTYAYTT